MAGKLVNKLIKCAQLIKCAEHICAEKRAQRTRAEDEIIHHAGFNSGDVVAIIYKFKSNACSSMLWLTWLNQLSDASRKSGLN